MGDVEVVVMVGISFLVAVVLSLVIGVKSVRSYRASHDRGIALLTVGILFLSGVPVSVTVALRMFATAPGWAVTTTGNLIRLLGIMIIIVTIYDQ